MKMNGGKSVWWISKQSNDGYEINTNESFFWLLVWFYIQIVIVVVTIYWTTNNRTERNNGKHENSPKMTGKKRLNHFRWVTNVYPS